MQQAKINHRRFNAKNFDTQHQGFTEIDDTPSPTGEGKSRIFYPKRIRLEKKIIKYKYA